jgi:hypothetical protein
VHSVADSVDIEKLVGELEIGVDRLRSLYEQYFMGIEKLEPMVPRKDVDRRIHVLRKEQIRNTALRFRFQMILQRYNTYQTHWQRVCREIENGTYRRHVVRAQQRFASQSPGPGRRESVRPPAAAALPRDLEAELAELDKEFAPAETVDELDVELMEDLPPARPRQPPPPSSVISRAPPRLTPAPQSPGPPRPLPRPSPPPPRPPPPAGASRPVGPPAPQPPPRQAPVPSNAPAPRAPGPAPLARPAPTTAAAPPGPRLPGDLADDRIRQLYAQYVDVKRRQNESTATITYEAVAKSLRDSSAKLREKHGKPVDFEVTVKDGKTILKPVLK